MERQPRPVEILDIQVEKIKLPRIWICVSCSKGTYIRTLCHDIGKKLGCGGCMESLVRIRSGSFCVEDSLKLGEIEALRDLGKVADCVIPLEMPFWDLPALVMKSEIGDKRIWNGNPFDGEMAAVREDFQEEPLPFAKARVYDSKGCFIGIYGYDDKKKRYQPQKLFLGGS